ncbi:hypothetical protein ARMGADRAFT_1026213 [Armillaria gallica]|uniref:Uncharacterized protein n=1 Tax=Armillaria gallica TaxID=47427 RepID=A0A2H3EF93_ARMGA|nr:hypothetical protein ARMGADRAFT_1026213 [Armillaria gallica]
MSRGFAKDELMNTVPRMLVKGFGTHKLQSGHHEEFINKRHYQKGIFAARAIKNDLLLVVEIAHCGCASRRRVRWIWSRDRNHRISDRDIFVDVPLLLTVTTTTKTTSSLSITPLNLSMGTINSQIKPLSATRPSMSFSVRAGNPTGCLLTNRLGSINVRGNVIWWVGTDRTSLEDDEHSAYNTKLDGVKTVSVPDPSYSRVQQR